MGCCYSLCKEDSGPQVTKSENISSIAVDVLKAPLIARQLDIHVETVNFYHDSAYSGNANLECPELYARSIHVEIRNDSRCALPFR